MEGIKSAGSSIAKRCCRWLQYGLLVCALPPLLNHAALQTEREQLLTNGELRDVGSGQNSQKMYLRCEGQGAPTVVLDSAAGMSSDVWLAVLPRISEMTRTCVFDRPGLGFSDRPPASEQDPRLPALTPPPYTSGSTVLLLRLLLTELTTQPPPLVYVGAGLGALNGRLYARLHPGEVSDLVLVSPLTESLLAEEDGAWLQHVRSRLLPPLQTLHVAAATGLTRLMLMSGLMEPPLAEAADVLGDEAINRQKHLMCHPRHMSSVVDEHHFLNETGAQLRRAALLPALPSAARPTVTVVTSTGRHDSTLPDSLNDAWAAAVGTAAAAEGGSGGGGGGDRGETVLVEGADGVALSYMKPERLAAVIRGVVRARRARLSEQRPQQQQREATTAAPAASAPAASA